MKLATITNIFTRKSETALWSDDPARLLFSQYAFLQKCCCKAVGLLSSSLDGTDIAKELEAEELLNMVIERLRKDDYQALRAYTGVASITTWLSTIVANLARDRYRTEHGRDRSRDRAEQFGETGQQLYRLIVGQGYSIDAAREWMVREQGKVLSLNEVDIMVEAFRRRHRSVAPPSGTVVIDSDGEDSEREAVFTLRDDRPLPDELLASARKDLFRKNVLDEVLGRLSGEERYLLQLRFPPNDDVPKSIVEIGRLLGVTEKAADHRLRRLLTGVRETFIKQGISFDDLLDAG
jgi:RNA polymerase sigma factor (sigma-70 family)